MLKRTETWVESAKKCFGQATGALLNAYRVGCEFAGKSEA